MQNAVINLKESFISLCVFFSYCIALACLKWSYTKQLVSAVTGFPPVLQILTQQRKLFRSDVEDESPEKKPDISSFAPQGFRTLVHTHFQESWMDLCWFVVLGFKTRLWLSCVAVTHTVYIMTGFTSLCESFRFYGELNRRVDHVHWLFTKWLPTSR